MRFSPALLLLAAITLSGCGNVHNLAAKARAKKERERLEKLTEASAGEAESRLGHRALGEVASVNAEDQFVLLRPLVGVVIPPGTELESRRGNTRTGVLRVAKEKKSLFTVADLVEGSPQNGDSIFASKSKTPPPLTPVPASGLAGARPQSGAAPVPVSSLMAPASTVRAGKPGEDAPLLPPPSFEQQDTEPVTGSLPVPAAGVKSMDDDFDPANLPKLPGRISKPEDVRKQ